MRGLDLLEVVDANRAAVAFFREVHLHEIPGHDQFKEISRRIDAGHRFRPISLPRFLPSLDEVLVDDAGGDTVDRECFKGSPHVTTRVSILETARYEGVETRS